MKKIVALLLASVMILSLAGCGAAANATPEQKEVASEAVSAAAEAAKEVVEEKKEEVASSGKPYEGVELTFWWPPFGKDPELALWQGLFEKFTEETGATVTCTAIPWDEISTKYMTGFMGGEGPDVFYMINDLNESLYNAGVLGNLEDVYSDEEKANQLAWAMGYKKDGGTYTIPAIGGTDFRPMIFNMDLLAKVGVTEKPETWDEAVEVAQKLKEAGVCEYPILYDVDNGAGAPVDTIIPMLYSSGARIMDADEKEVLLNTPDAIDAYQFLYDLSNKYEVLSKDCVTFSEENVQDLFAEGKVGMASLPVANIMAKEDIPFKWDIVTQIHKEGKEPITFNAYDAIAYNAQSKNPEAAAALLKYVTSTECRNAFRENVYAGTAALNADQEPSKFAADCVTEAAKTIADHSIAPLSVAAAPTINQELTTVQQLLVLGEITPEEAGERLQKAAEEALDE